LDNVNLQLSYKATDLIVEQELEGNSNADTSIVSMLREQYGKYAYFVLNLSSNTGNLLYQDMAYFNERLQNLSYRMDQYVYLTTSSEDTIAVADYNYPRMFSHSTSLSLLFAFERERIKETKWIDFHLKESGFGFGNQRFRFETKKIQNTPKILF
jgi:hypothetical protein